MNTNTTYSVSLKFSDGGAAGIIKGIGNSALDASTKIGKLFSAAKAFGDVAITFNNIRQSLQILEAGLDNVIVPGAELNASFKDLSAITSETGAGLKLIEKNARATSEIFGGSAAQSVESYKLILSQLSPELAKVSAALRKMGDSIAITSMMIGADSAAAANVLSTAMNQFKVSLDDPMAASAEMTRMINIMAAGAKKGSAKFPLLQEALSQSGMSAKAAKVSFAETIVAIEMLDKAGKKGAEGGLALLSGLDQLEQWKSAIEGANSGLEQANIIMSSYNEKMVSMKLFVDDAKISLFDFAQGSLPYMKRFFNFMHEAVTVLTDLDFLLTISESALGKAIGMRARKTWQATTAVLGNAKAMMASLVPMQLYSFVTGVSTIATLGLAAAVKILGKSIYGIPIIGWIAAGISLIVGGFTLAWQKSEKFRQVVFSIFEVIKVVFHNIGVVIKAVFDNIIKPYVMFWFNLYKGLALGIWEALKWCWDGIVAGIQSIGAFFSGLWSGIISGVTVVAEYFSSTWTWIQEACSGVVTSIVNAFSFIVEPIKGVFTTLWDFIKGILDKVIDKLKKPIEVVQNLWNKLFPKDKFKSIDVAIETGKNKGTESWEKSQAKNKDKDGDIGGISSITTTPVVAPIASPIASPIAPPPVASPIASPIASPALSPASPLPAQKETQAAKSSEPIDLNNIKGSTSYDAIAAKLTPKSFQGLSSSTATITADKASRTAGTNPQDENLFNPAKLTPKSFQGLSSSTSTITVDKTSRTAGTNPQGKNLFNPAKQDFNPAQKKDYIPEISKTLTRIAAGIALLVAASAITPPISLEGAAPIIKESTYEHTSAFYGSQGEQKTDKPSSFSGDNRQKTRVQFAKFCEQVVINLPSGTSKAHAQDVVKEVMKQLNSYVS